MDIFKRILRWIILIILILFALSGIGIGAIISPKKERDYDNEIKTELVEGEADQLSEMDNKNQE